MITSIVRRAVFIFFIRTALPCISGRQGYSAEESSYIILLLFLSLGGTHLLVLSALFVINVTIIYAAPPAFIWPLK